MDRETERTTLRTCMVGGLTAADEGAELRVTGWVHRRRDLGGLLFMDIRDRSGLLQVSVGPDWSEPKSLELAPALGAEDVVVVEGRIERRPDPNPEMPTGEVELRAVRVERYSAARTPVIPVYRSPEEELPSEDLRLRHRVLDLRRPELQHALTIRRSSDGSSSSGERYPGMTGVRAAEYRSTSRSSWLRATTDTSRSRAASGTRISGRIASPSSRRSTSRRRS
ncbi:MAG: OB-fold nucleic acid binding domain-containing protein [Gemmatimonadota bacterium]